VMRLGGVQGVRNAKDTTASAARRWWCAVVGSMPVVWSSGQGRLNALPNGQRGVSRSHHVLCGRLRRVDRVISVCGDPAADGFDDDRGHWFGGCDVAGETDQAGHPPEVADQEFGSSSGVGNVVVVECLARGQSRCPRVKEQAPVYVTASISEVTGESTRCSTPSRLPKPAFCPKPPSTSPAKLVKARPGEKLDEPTNGISPTVSSVACVQTNNTGTNKPHSPLDKEACNSAR
jgi:hypothetical protein